MNDVVAFVMAAGFGTRLRPFTDVVPKPLVPVCGVPVLAYCLRHLASHGLTRAVVNAHHLGDQIREWQGEHEGVLVSISTELPDILGTAGGLAAVKAQLADRFVVVNGDVLTDADLGSLLHAVPNDGCAMALRRHPADAAAYGPVAVDANGRVVQLREWQAERPGDPPDRSTHFTGTHAMAASTLTGLDPVFSDVIDAVYIPRAKLARVRGVIHHGVWLDIGNPSIYLDTNLAVLRGDVTVDLDPLPRAAFAKNGHQSLGSPPTCQLHGAVWVGHSAQIHPSARLVDTVIGARAVVGHATLTRCVVWDGATVPTGDHSDTVFYGSGTWTRA